MLISIAMVRWIFDFSEPFPFDSVAISGCRLDEFVLRDLRSGCILG